MKTNKKITPTATSTYQALYVSSSFETSKEIEAKTIEEAEIKASDSIMFPIEISDYETMEIHISNDNGDVISVLEYADFSKQ